MFKIRDYIIRVLKSVIILLLGVMVVNVCWQVFSRYVLNNPSRFTDELARYLMIWLAFFGSALISKKNLHVTIDILPSSLSKKNKSRINTINLVVIIFFTFLIFVIGGGNLMFISLELGQKSAALQVPLYLVYSCIPLSGCIIIFIKICELIKIK